MRRVAYSLYMLPGRTPKAPPYRSSWKMSPAEAAAIGALYPVADTIEYRNMPESPEEERQKIFGAHPSAGHTGVRPPNR